MVHIDNMRDSDMEVASEFLEMAARLVYIKSLSLLPKHEEEEELKKELTGQLLEYRLCKLMAGKMGKMQNLNILVKNAENIKVDHEYKRIHLPEELLKYYFMAVGRGKRFLPPPAEKFTGIVSHRVVSVTSQIVFVLRKLWLAGKTGYDSLFKDKHEKSERVATFLALLALVKDKRVRIEEEGQTVLLIKGGRKSANK